MEKIIYEKLKINNLITKIVPLLDNKKIKGDNGVIGVIGGSFEYTGAPYYSGISALKSGSDLSHVFCSIDSAIPIKSYSPELIVHPGFDNYKDNPNLLNKTARWFKSMDCLIYGPGLGREESTSYIFNFFLKESIKIDNIVHIIDADGLWHFINLDLNILNNDSLMILTPNKKEFERLMIKFGMQESNDNLFDYNFYEVKKDEILYFKSLEGIYHIFKNEIDLANRLSNKIILKKGYLDIITDGRKMFIIGNNGSSKRCGGIGDILNGIIATFTTMLKKQIISDNKIISNDVLIEAVALACFICRESSRSAFEIHGYSLTAPNILTELSKYASTYKF